MDEQTYHLPQAKKTFSRIGLAFSAILVVATALQLLWFWLPDVILGENNALNASFWWMWLGSIVPMQLIGIPLGVLIMRGLPAQKPEDHKLSVKLFLEFLTMSFCLMYVGNWIGTFLSSGLSDGQATNAVAEMAMDTNPLKILAMVILAPLLEEFLCRKVVIDRTRQYGEKLSVVLSALIFGLLHQNLFQFFYAFGLGLVFGFIYIRTGRLRYTVLLHIIINFMGGVAAPWIISQVDLNTMMNLDPTASTAEIMALYEQILPGLLLLLGYVTVLLGLAITGLVLLIKRCKNLYWADAEEQLPKGTVGKTAYRNVGMILYMALCAVSIILALI